MGSSGKLRFFLDEFSPKTVLTQETMPGTSSMRTPTSSQRIPTSSSQKTLTASQATSLPSANTAQAIWLQGNAGTGDGQLCPARWGRTEEGGSVVDSYASAGARAEVQLG